MITYNTYAEAKIAHQGSEIVTTGPNWKHKNKNLVGKFSPFTDSPDGAFSHIIGDESWIICKPVDYLMSLDDFFEAGHKFVDGDYYIALNGDVEIVGRDFKSDKINIRHGFDGKMFVLSAKALDDRAVEDFYDPEFERVEWKNGDDCIYMGNTDTICKFASIHPNNPKCAIVWEGDGDINLSCVAIDCLSKPETPEQKKEREHAVYNMCSSLDNHTEDAKCWAGRFYVAGYRKPE